MPKKLSTFQGEEKLKKKEKHRKSAKLTWLYNKLGKSWTKDGKQLGKSLEKFEEKKLEKVREKFEKSWGNVGKSKK